VAAGDGGGDALTLERVDQPGGVAGEQHGAAGGQRADGAHLQPATQARPGGGLGVGQQPEVL
jgi:hypothetical protein